MKNGTTALILAGGSGERMGNIVPKQFLEIAGKPIIQYSIEKFEKNGLIDEICIVCREDHIKKLEVMIKRCGAKKIAKILPGGPSRQESSYLGVRDCSRGMELVLIHDAVRPLIGDNIIKDVLAAAKEVGAACPAIRIDDTMVVKKGDFIGEIPERDLFRRVQTPQGFRLDVILKAHEKAKEKGFTDATDDCGLVFLAGGLVKIVEGAKLNIKITKPIDMLIAESLISPGKTNGGRKLDAPGPF